MPALSSKRLLDPIDRTSEILFGLIMALTFTGSISVATQGTDEIRTILIGAIGCNLAWGLVDAFMYLMTTFTERARGAATLKAVRGSAQPATAHQLIADALPPIVSSVLKPTELEGIRQRLHELSEPATRARLYKDDFLAALAVFGWVVVSTFPVVIPFTFMHEPGPALRVSNAIAIVMLFLAGYSLGRHGNHRPWLMGLCMVVIGSALVAITIALGG